jgi:hypothetical protein
LIFGVSEAGGAVNRNAEAGRSRRKTLRGKLKLETLKTEIRKMAKKRGWLVFLKAFEENFDH